MGLKYESLKEHIKELGFDLDIEKYPMLIDAIKYYEDNEDINGLEHYMKQLQNCGGYALQLPICIFSGNDYTFEEQVLRIMELYPFVRLLSDTKLKDNEYIVKFRSGKTGHHFIREDENGIITEKHECNLPERFQDWGTLKDTPEAVFAVTKQEDRDEEIIKLPQCNRSMFLNEDAYYEIEDDGQVYIEKKKAARPKTFTNILKESYNNKANSFTYNNKVFYFKKDKDEQDIIYICDESQVLGSFCSDGEEFVIEIDEEKKNYIFGFQPINLLKNKRIAESTIIER